jgi:cytochrome c oxidase subunit 2
MDIHKYEKLWFGLALLLIITFIGTIAYGSVGAGVKMVDDEGGTVDPDSLSEHERFGNTGVYQVNDSHYEVNMIAIHPSFIPGNITVPEGSTVDFYITSGDVTHGFQLAGTNVNTMIIPGQISKLTVEFDEPGEYGAICNEYCGELHHTMEAKVNVLPEDQWSDDMATGNASDIGGDA